MHAKLLQLCPTLCNPMDCSLPGSSVLGISHAYLSFVHYSRNHSSFSLGAIFHDFSAPLQHHHGSFLHDPITLIPSSPSDSLHPSSGLLTSCLEHLSSLLISCPMSSWPFHSILHHARVIFPLFSNDFSRVPLP